MSISVISIVRDKIIVPSLLRAVISPVNSDFENESNITNSYRRICEINDHASYFRGETSYLNLNGSPDCFKNYENIFLSAFNCLIICECWQRHCVVRLELGLTKSIP